MTTFLEVSAGFYCFQLIVFPWFLFMIVDYSARHFQTTAELRKDVLIALSFLVPYLPFILILGATMMKGWHFPTLKENFLRLIGREKTQ